MLNDSESDDLRARIAEVEAQRVPLNDRVALVLAMGGWRRAGADLSSAGSGVRRVRQTTAPMRSDWAAAVLALLALIWELRTAFAGDIDSAPARLLVDDAESLVVLVALLVAMALGGLILAARGETPATSGAGYGLCIFGIVVAFANLKHYFDRFES